MTNHSDQTICIALYKPGFHTAQMNCQHGSAQRDGVWQFDKVMELMSGNVSKYYCRRLCGAVLYVPQYVP